MAREQGTFEFPANFEVKKDGMIDARQYVDTFADLLNFTASNFIGNGFPVCVRTTSVYNSTTKKKGWYQCVNSSVLSNEASWEFVGGVDFNGTNNKLPKFNNEGSIEDSVIEQLNTTNIKYGANLRFNFGNVNSPQVVIYPNKTGVIAFLDDIQPPVDVSGKNTYLQNTSYSTVGEIIYYIREDETEFYKVNNSFTSSNLGSIETDLQADITAGNLTLVPVKGNTLEIWTEDTLYGQFAFVIDPDTYIIYWALQENAEPLDTDSVWKPISTYIDNDNDTDYTTFSSNHIVSLLAAKLDKTLQEDYIFQGNASNEAVANPTEDLFVFSIGDIELTELYLITNYPNTKPGQMGESSTHYAIRLQQGWNIFRKNLRKLLTKTINLSSDVFWDAENKTIDISTLIGVNTDIIKFDSNFSTQAITVATQADPAVVTIGSGGIRYFKNDDLITIADASGMTEINGARMVKNIDYDAGTFELYETDGTTTVDTSAASAYVGLGTVVFTDGNFRPRIEKIKGLPDRETIYFISEEGEIPKFIRTNLISNIDNSIEIEGGSDFDLEGRTVGSDIVQILKDNNINLILISKNY